MSSVAGNGADARGFATPIAALAVTAFVALGAWQGFSPARAGLVSFWLFVLGPTVLLAALGLARAYRDGDFASWMRPRWGDFSLGFALTLGLFAGAYAFVRVVVPAASPREGWLARLYLQLGDPSVLREHAFVVGAVLVVAAAAEEIVWRGLVTSLLAERFGSRFAWIGAAVLYALAQLPAAFTLRDEAAGLNPVLPLAALGAGLAWGAMARFSGRLTPGIVSHALFDWCVIMTFRLWGPSV